MKTCCVGGRKWLWKAAGCGRCSSLGLQFVSAVVALLVSGCATHRSASSSTSAISQELEPQVSNFGTIAIAEESSPASFGFQKAKGKLGSAKEALLDSAALGLSGPGAGVFATGAVLKDEFACANSDGDPIFFAALAGAAGGATAIGAAVAGPFVGLRGLILSLKSISAAELLEREAALTNGLSQMAAQQNFRDALLQAGAEKINRGFRTSRSTEPSKPGGPATVDGILQARVEDLRLKRAGSSEASYFLSIKTHVRLTRLAGGVIYFDQDVEYRSGTALFLDWTLQGAIQGVAETGYKMLARYYVSKLVDGSADCVGGTLVVKGLKACDSTKGNGASSFGHHEPRAALP